MFNNILLNPKYVGPEPERPKRLYARLDQTEGSYLLFDTVNADYFDGLPDVEGVGGWTKYSAKAPVYVLLATFGVHSTNILLEPLDDEDIWFEIVLDWSASDSTLYFNLFMEGFKVGLSEIRFVSQARARQLANAFSLSGLQRTKTEIENVLKSVPSNLDWVGVYDVGQGSANGVCDTTETPQVYFDLGGGVNNHQSTFPLALTDFCYKASPPVVLSHWDWDHWSSGAKFAGAQNLDWIVPLQRLGGVHSTLAAGLHNAKRLFVWPNTLPSVSSGQLTILKCSGQGTGRNHTGLAMEVEGPKGEDPILLTGDARYSAIPGALNATFTSLVVPHHGADMRSRSVPQGTGLPGARTAFSYDQKNTYGHPHKLTEQDHNNGGWPQSSLLANLPIDRATAKRVGGLGHIGLSWSPSPQLPGHSCSSSTCAVGLRQT